MDLLGDASYFCCVAAFVRRQRLPGCAPMLKGNNGDLPRSQVNFHAPFKEIALIQ